MKLNLDLPIIRYDGSPAKFPNGDIEHLGEALSIVIGNAPVKPDKLHWASKMAGKLAACGELELPPSEVGLIVEFIPTAPIGTWAKGPMLFLLGEEVKDKEALVNYHKWYGESPHDASVTRSEHSKTEGGNGSVSAADPEVK